MSYIARNCPNCTAPLRVHHTNQIAFCAYCGSTVVPDVESSTKERSTAASERTAAELALRRLPEERLALEVELEREQYLAQEPQREAEREYSRILKAYENAEEKLRIERAEAIYFRNLSLGVGIGVVILFLASQVSFFAYLSILVFFVSAAAQWSWFSNNKKLPRPQPSPMPDPIKSDREEKILQRINEIDKEIQHHQEFLMRASPISVRKI